MKIFGPLHSTYLGLSKCKFFGKLSAALKRNEEHFQELVVEVSDFDKSKKKKNAYNNL